MPDVPQRYGVLLLMLSLTAAAVYLGRRLRYFDPLKQHTLRNKWRRQNERR